MHSKQPQSEVMEIKTGVLRKCSRKEVKRSVGSSSSSVGGDRDLLSLLSPLQRLLLIPWPLLQLSWDGLGCLV